MKSNLLLRQIFGVTLLALLFTSFFFAGCGAFEEDNSQPTIETIADKTLNVGDETKVEVTITDADVDDTHTISAFADDTTVATVAVRDATLTITGMATGITVVKVSVTDDSGQDNAAATLTTFLVTVKELVNKGTCITGLTLQPGESCSYGPKIVFSVRQDGTVCRESELPVYREVFGINIELGKLCGNYDIEQDDYFETNFAASKNPDGSWTIDRTAGTGNWPIDDVSSTSLCQIPPLDEDFRGTPVLVGSVNEICILLSDGNFVALACSIRGVIGNRVIGGQIQTPTNALVEFAGGDIRNGAGEIPDGELTEFEVSDAIKGVMTLTDNRSSLRVQVPTQEGLTLRGPHTVRIGVVGKIACISDRDNAITAALTALAEDMLDIMRKNQ